MKIDLSKQQIIDLIVACSNSIDYENTFIATWENVKDGSEIKVLKITKDHISKSKKLIKYLKGKLNNESTEG